MSATRVFFDLDGTITRGDTYLAYLLFALRRRPHRLVRCLALPYDALMLKLGRLPNHVVKARFLAAILGGCSRTEITTLTSDFVRQRLPRLVKPKARERIALHTAQGHQLVLVTASLDIYANEVGALLGFESVISTRVAWVHDAVSGALDGPNLLGEAKLAAVRQALAASGGSPEFTVAYSDHHSDLPLLCFADRGIAVDPSPRLAAAAHARQLAIETWAEK